VNLPTAVATCFKKYATFSGTASRPEYWWFALFNFIVAVILILTRVPALNTVWSLAVLVPGLAVAVRRLHDSGRSAWWLLTGLIPLWLLILLCFPGKETNNRYAVGGSSSAWTPSVTEASATTSTAKCPSCGKMRLPGQNYCMGCGTKFTDA
jgi:uncharacterized membrane protein YhaH (DUF805 family)